MAAKKRKAEAVPETTIEAEVLEEASQQGPSPIDVFVCLFDTEHLEEAKSAVSMWRAQIGVDQGVRVTIAIPGGLVSEAEALQALLSQGGERLRFAIDPNPLMQFQRGRRIMADACAESEVYIVADSDCIPISTTFVQRGLEIMNRPEYAEFMVLTPWPINADIVDWSPHPDEVSKAPIIDGVVCEHVDVGGIRFTRKGHLEMGGWRPQQENRRDPNVERGWKYDRDHAEMIRERGGRVGLMRSVMYRHLGEGRQ